MVYEHFDPTPPTSLIVLKRKPVERQPKDWSSTDEVTRGLSATAWRLAYRFGKSTTIHGVNRLFGESASRFERFVWLFTVISSFLGSIYVSIILSKRFKEAQFQTVVDDARLPVYRIPFPVVTICNLNRLNWGRIEEAKHLFLPEETSVEKLELFERIVATYDNIRFAEFDKFSVLQQEKLEQLNHINFSLVVDFMSWRCEEMLKNCMWRQQPMDCCDIFSMRRTKNGLCLAFNTLESEEGRRMQRLDPMWPWHTGGMGPKTALNVKVLMNPDKHLPKRFNSKGLIVMITEPNVWHWQPIIVPADTETMISIKPVIFFYDNETRSVSSLERQCVFANEQTSRSFRTLQGFPYMMENCHAECHQEYLMRYCNCTVDLLFPPGKYPSCKIKDMLCLAKFNDHFAYSHRPGEEKFLRHYHEGMVCKCYRNCYSLNYMMDVRPASLSADVRGNVSFVDLDVHFRIDSIVAYRTSLVFGWLDLIVAFGGIASLFLGCSLISALELAYFALFELPNFLVDEFKERWHQRRRSNLNDMRKLGITSCIRGKSEKSYNRVTPANSLRQQDGVVKLNRFTLPSIHNKIYA